MLKKFNEMASPKSKVDSLKDEKKGTNGEASY